MKIQLTFLLFTIFSLNLNAQNAKDIFLENLTAFEKLKDENESISLDRVYESREFLIEITGITYELEKPFDMPAFPPEKTLKDWRAWYETNKDRLYWDEKEKKIKVHKK